MRIALITNMVHDQLGLFYISAVLKKNGHDVRYFFANRNLERNLRRFSPQLVGFSILTGNHLWAQECALFVKNILYGVKTIIGGAHATYYPEIINHPGIDIVCRGEGENSVLELCNAIENNKNFYTTKGMWIKDGDTIYKNNFTTLIDNLDTLPFPDRTIYNNYRLFTLYPFVISSRGCPFSCTFCFEPVQREYFKGRGKYVRFRSPENVIQEVLEIKKTYRIKIIEFVDDIFGIKREWLRKFSELWKKEVKLPFKCNFKADMVDEEVAELLKESGCISVAFGIESGSERVRNKIYKKGVNRESIFKAAEVLKNHKIKIITFNILGAPGESYEEVWETVYINQKIKADYAYVSLMHPYHHTEIYKIAVNGGYIDSEERVDINRFPLTFHDIFPVPHPYSDRLINLQKLFNLAVWIPWLTPIIRFLVKLPVNPIYYFIFITLHAYHWFRIKRVPILFLFNLLWNVGKVSRKQKHIISHQIS